MFVRVRVFALLSLLHPEDPSVNDRIHRLGLEAGSIRVTTQARWITSLQCGLFFFSFFLFICEQPFTLLYNPDCTRRDRI